MKGQSIQLKIGIDSSPDDDLEEIAELTRQLRSELIDLDVDSVDFVNASKEPESSKAIGAVSVGSLLVLLTPSGGVLTTLITAIQSWLSSKEQSKTSKELSTVTLEIGGDKLEVTNVTSVERKRLIDLWVGSHEQ